jgi:hypothetical protein
VTRPPRKVDSLCVFAPIREGHAGALEAQLGDLPTGEASPMNKLKGTHMARFVVIPHLKRSNGAPLDDTAYLLFASEFDAPFDAYLDALAALPEARQAFAHCAGYRDDGQPESLRRFLGDYRVQPGYSVVAFPEASLDDVKRSLELRDRLADFALRTRDFDAASRKREWLATFAEGG